MKIQSILVVALVEIDIFDENGSYTGTNVEQRQIHDLNEAVRIVGQAYRSDKKRKRQDGIQPKSP